jgi:hypothetical protein
MSRRPNGPIEDRDVPSDIEAKVMTPGPDPLLHGFSVERDLALHYRFPELVQIALTGVAPEPAEGRAFDIALQFLAPLAIAEAPTHAAVLARLFGARTSSIVAVACIALAERARYVIAQHADLLAWLELTDGAPPDRHRSSSPEDTAGVDRLQAALTAAGVAVPRLVPGLGRWAGLVVTLHFAGIRRPEQLETVLVMASLAPTMAEAASHAPTEIGRYPINLPPFVYDEGP